MTPSNEPTKALMPCPFCGEPEPSPEAYTNEYWVRCPKCDATCATCYSEICARDKWNTRAPLPGVTMGGEVIDELAKLRAFHACYAVYEGLPYQIPPGKEVAETWLAAPKPHSAEVREVSEEDVERALTAYDPEIDWPKYRRNFHVEHAYFAGKMRAALVAYERGRK